MSAKIIWMSDLHFTADGDVLGHDPRVRLTRAVAHINAHHRDAAYCVISGDLVNRGTVADYEALAGILAQLQVPVLPMVGNHDDRKLLRQALAVPDDAMDDFVQYAVTVGARRLLCLDTLTPGADHGTLCPARLAWVAAQLDAAAGAPVTLFLHHPPLALGLPMQDEDRLLDADGLRGLVMDYAGPLNLCIGHVHRPITGTWAGRPFATMRAVLYQAPAPVPAWDWTSFAPAQEDPQIGVLTCDGEDLQIQYETFCRYADGAR